jgi:hypothetical protein
MAHISVRLTVPALALAAVMVVMGPSPAPLTAQTSPSEKSAKLLPPPSTHFDTDVDFRAPSGNEIVELQATLVVPPRPPSVGTVFLWPGLQPEIDNGVLQSVLTWGDSCATEDLPPTHSSWWISAQYVQSRGDCRGGETMLVEPGDRLRIRFQLSGTTWFQSILNASSGQEVKFEFDLENEAQTQAIFAIETDKDAIAPSVVVFEDIVLRFRSPNDPDKMACRVSVSPMKSSKGYWDQKVIGLVALAGDRECTVQRIRLSRADHR